MDFISFVFLLLLIALSAFFSSSEIAFFSLSKEKRRNLSHSACASEQAVSTLLARSRDFLVLIFFLNTLVNSLVQNISSSLFDESSQEMWLKIILPFLLILFIGEYVPKYIGLMQGEALAKASSRFFLFLKKILHRPIQKITTLAENLSSVMFCFLKPEAPLQEKNFLQILTTSQSLGLITTLEASLIKQIMDLKAKTAKDVLLPLREIPKLQKLEFSHTKALARFKESCLHIILLVEGPSEEVRGIIDDTLLGHHAQDINDICTKAQRKLSFVPAAMHIDRLLLHLEQEKTPYAGIYDEHGKVIGILSAKLLRNYLMQMLHSTPPSMKHEKQEIEPLLFAGTTSLNMICDLFHVELISEHEQKTIGGWLTEQFDAIPQPGTSLIFSNLLFQIVEADETRIQQLYIQPVKLENKEKKP